MYRFGEYLEQQGYSDEKSILDMLPNLDVVQQALLDRRLHQDAVSRGSFGLQGSLLAKDSQWKNKVIDILTGKENDPEVIRQTIDIIKKDVVSHKNRLPSVKTGSQAWHAAWIKVYEGWLERLKQILGVLDGTQEIR